MCEECDFIIGPVTKFLKVLTHSTCRRTIHRPGILFTKVPEGESFTIASRPGCTTGVVTTSTIARTQGNVTSTTVALINIKLGNFL